MAVDGRWFGFAKIKGESLRFIWFNLMPWPYLPDDFREKYRSVWVDIPSSLYDPPIAFAVELAVLDVISRSGLMAIFRLDSPWDTASPMTGSRPFSASFGCEAPHT